MRCGACDERLVAGEMNSHLLEHCLESEIECPLGCGATMKRKLLGSSRMLEDSNVPVGLLAGGIANTDHDPDGLDQHLAVCLNIRLECPFKCIGCSETGIRREGMDEHLVREAQSHAKLVANSFEKQKADAQEMKQALADAQEKEADTRRALGDAHKWVGKNE